METTSYCVVFFQQIAGTVDRCFWMGQLEPFQRLTIFLTDSSRCSNDSQFFWTDSSNRSNGWWTSSEILTFIFNTSRELPKEKADFANIERMIMCTNKDFVSTLIFEYNTHWKALESLKICEQTFVCFQGLFLRPPLHNSSASQAELVTDCWDKRTVSWTLALRHG